MSLDLDQLLSEARETARSLAARNIPTHNLDGLPSGWLLWSAVSESRDQRTSRLDDHHEFYLTTTGKIVAIHRETLHEDGRTMCLPILNCSAMNDDESLTGWWKWAVLKPALGIRNYPSGPVQFLRGHLQAQLQRTR